jgi:hypothetical protein
MRTTASTIFYTRKLLPQLPFPAITFSFWPKNKVMKNGWSTNSQTVSYGSCKIIAFKDLLPISAFLFYYLQQL